MIRAIRGPRMGIITGGRSVARFTPDRFRLERKTEERMGSLDRVMMTYSESLSMDVDRDKLLGMMPGMLKLLALRPDRREAIFAMMPGMMADAGVSMDDELVMDMMPYAAELLDDHPDLGKEVIGVMVEMMGVFGMYMKPAMVMKMMPLMMPLMMRHPRLMPPFMKAMPAMMRRPAGAGSAGAGSATDRQEAVVSRSAQAEPAARGGVS